MTTADVRDEAPPEPSQPDGERPAVSSARSPRTSPGLAAGWLLRTAGFASVAAGLAALVVAPGVRGNASESIVVVADRASAVLAYFLGALLLALVIWGALELVRVLGVSLPPRLALIGTGGLVVILAIISFKERLHFPVPVVLSIAASVAAIAGAWASARAPHTRAAAGVLISFAFAALARLAAWRLAMSASDQGSMQLYDVSRGLATAGVLFEGFGQLVAVAWLGTRSKLWGQLGAFVAVAGALVLTWGVAKGVHSGASLWQAMLHTALADAPGVPSPFGLDKVAVFLVPSSLLLALVSVAQPRQVAAVVAVMALALVSRGAFDAPLRALCAVTAAVWSALACADERAMWRTLIEDRKRRLEEDGSS
jgi:hypothetical protein